MCVGSMYSSLLLYVYSHAFCVLHVSEHSFCVLHVFCTCVLCTACFLHMHSVYCMFSAYAFCVLHVSAHAFCVLHVFCICILCIACFCSCILCIACFCMCILCIACFLHLYCGWQCLLHVVYVCTLLMNFFQCFPMSFRLYYALAVSPHYCTCTHIFMYLVLQWWVVVIVGTVFHITPCNL